ncbi:aldo/keto reductase [Vibrio ulleungensis]|uniref:Aldo/keto reductase n=1 Tax=Vibrio ulleungensis TaxID=2807619 RepID=A0ABS2HCW4_9VIBR|nr:aldo/keto reductase [Vibrio ulleungensis]MBM7035430.1 aldo/keto reductase [Vibrio ulleungensis]
MQYKNVKDLNASAIGFGCWAIGGTWNNIDDKHSIATIRAAIDHNINFFDVAPIYGKGHAETILGKALKGIERDKVIVATKCGLPWNNAGDVRNDLSKANIFKEIDQSLSRLNLDVIDLYQVHWPDPNTPISETADALAELKHQGKIKHVGVSNYSLEMTLEMMKGVDVATFQGLYNLLEQNPTHYHSIPLQYRAREQALPFCEQHDLKYLPYSPLMQGLLTGTFKRHNNFDHHDDRSNNPKLNDPLFESYYECVEELKRLADSANVSITALAMQWLTNQPHVGPVIAGAHTVEQVIANAATLQKTIDLNLILQAEAIVDKWQLK